MGPTGLRQTLRRGTSTFLIGRRGMIVRSGRPWWNW